MYVFIQMTCENRQEDFFVYDFYGANVLYWCSFFHLFDTSVHKSINRPEVFFKEVLHKKTPVSGFLYYKITGPESEANKKPVNGCFNQAVTKKFTLDGVQVKLELSYERSPYTNVLQHLTLMRSLMELMQPFAKTVFVHRFCYTLYSALKSSVFFVFQIELRDQSFHDRFFCINISHMAYLTQIKCFKIIFSGESGFLWNLQWLRPYIVSSLLKDLREIQGLSYICENVPVNTLFNRKLSRFKILDSHLCFYQKSVGPLYFIFS